MAPIKKYIKENCNESNEEHVADLYVDLPKQNTAAKSMYKQDKGYSEPDYSSRMVYLQEIIIHVSKEGLGKGADGAGSELGEETDESYQIHMVDNKSLAIKSNSIYGARHGIVTLWNLIESHNVLCDGETRLCNFVFFPYSKIEISDKPRYAHRGLMLDSSRNYQTIDTIKRIIYGMGLVKLNVFHWHIVDAPSFPFVGSNSARDIHGESCLSHGLCKAAYDYTQVYKSEDVVHIREYARLNGVRLVLEIDTPSHTASWGALHANLVVDPNLECCIQPPCGLLDLQRENKLVKQVVSKVWQDALALVNKHEYIHLGGDEVKSACFGDKTESLVVEYMDWLTSKMKEAHNRKSIIWSDMVRSYKSSHFDLRSVRVQVWLPEDLKYVADKGYDIIVSNYSAYYLDCGVGNWLFLDHKNWCDPFRSWYYFYMYDMHQGIEQHQYNQIKGGEVAMWSEQSGNANAEVLIWPRAAAAAETFWSRNTIVTHKHPKHILDAQERLRRAMNAFTILKIPNSPLQQQNCANSDICDSFYKDSGSNVFPPAVPDYKK